MRYLRFLSRLWKYSRVEGLQHNRRTDKACRANERGTQTGDDPIRSAQLGRTFATAIEDQQLMADQHGLGNHTAEPARLCQSNHNANQMNE